MQIRWELFIRPFLSNRTNYSYRKINNDATIKFKSHQIAPCENNNDKLGWLLLLKHIESEWIYLERLVELRVWNYLRPPQQRSNNFWIFRGIMFPIHNVWLRLIISFFLGKRLEHTQIEWQKHFQRPEGVLWLMTNLNLRRAPSMHINIMFRY